MPLCIDLKPFERLIINGASIRNGDRRSSFVFETHCRFLRETEIIYESEADTPCKKLWLTLQVLHLSEQPKEIEGQFYSQAIQLIRMMPSAAPYLAEINLALEENHTHKALKAAKRLVQHEREKCENAQGQSNAA
ncbi:flagellar protein FlbT [Methylobacterium sp. WL122]|nr:flagellar protein FlbT [Methylobacterium sp. WL122]